MYADLICLILSPFIGVFIGLICLYFFGEL